MKIKKIKYCLFCNEETSNYRNNFCSRKCSASYYNNKKSEKIKLENSLIQKNIENDYFKNSMTIKEICAKYNICFERFYKIIPKEKRRTLGESIKISRKRVKLILSEKTKKKISESMKKTHFEGKHPGWKSVNIDKNRRSVPEKFFYNYLLKNNFIEKYNIEEKLSVGKYYLDFAIVDKKIDIEIDGSQHYTEKSISYDKIRDQYLINNGWVIYRISWLKLINDMYNELQEFEKFILSDIISNRFYNRNEIIELKNNKKICDCGEIILKDSNTCRKCYNKKQRKVERPSYEQLLNEINESNYVQVGKKYGVSDNTIRKWVKNKH